MNLCEWDATEGHPGQSCVHLCARILSLSGVTLVYLSQCSKYMGFWQVLDEQKGSRQKLLVTRINAAS
jgi:hypothetical protein